MHTELPPSGSATHRLAVVLGTLAAAIGLLLALAAPAALAYSPRTYEYALHFPSEFSAPEGIAVDSSNRLWVNQNSSGNGTIYSFNPEGERLSTEIETSSSRVYSIAADHENGDIYEGNSFGAYEGSKFGDHIGVYNSTGAFLKSFEVGPGVDSIAADNSATPTAGRIYVGHGDAEFAEGTGIIESLDENGLPVPFEATATYIEGNELTGTPAGPFVNPAGLAVGTDGDLYVADSNRVDVFAPSGEFVREITGAGVPFGAEFAPRFLATDPVNNDLLVADRSTDLVDEFSAAGAYLGQLNGAETPHGSFSELTGLAVDSRGFLYVSDIKRGGGARGIIDVFSPSVLLPKVTHPGVSGAELVPNTEEASLTLGAEVSPDGGGAIETCEFEYVKESEYRPSAPNPFEAGESIPCSQPLPYPGAAPTRFSAEVIGIAPGTPYRYRLLAGNQSGTTEALPQTFDLQAPSIEGVSSSELTETTADLNAKINPEGGDTTYYFEYGTTASYESSIPVPPAAISSLAGQQGVTVHLANLAKGVVYHFRVVAENLFGTTATEDQSFNFLPPDCPNAHLRQQTGAEYLPDCRAYELASPPDAGGTVLLAEGPQSSLATNPSRLAFGGLLGKIPGSGGDPPDVFGDLYVATRTDTGWVTRYVGLPATQRAGANGPPNQNAYIEESPGGVLGDLNMDRFMDWADPYTVFQRGDVGDPGSSYAPYLWNSQGDFLSRLPTNLAAVPNGEGLEGGVKPSPEFNHYFFSSTASPSFAPGEETLAHAPGSAYDDDLEDNTVSVISKLPGGEPIEEGGGAYITFPGVSTDGSHILMSTGYECTFGCDPNYDYQGGRLSGQPHLENAERHLFMRVGGGPAGVTYEIAPGHAVRYVGMTADGSKVYFTSAERLTPEAEDSSTNLYMWSEKGELEGHPLTLISKPNGASGTGTPTCPPTSWTSGCGAVPYLTGPAEFLPDSILHGGPGGNGLSDNAIAAENGDIYFYSPAQLDGAKGASGQQNLYVYRDGEVQYVTTFNTGQFCGNASNCSEGPMVRIQVSPDDSHMAFLTASKITSYENAGYLEMYTYDPASGSIRCVSCIPDGAPPTSNVEASDNGLFMTDDGRVFFSAADPLVPQDTDGIRDVYEYVEGRPQLISSGTGSREVGISVLTSFGVPVTGLSRVGLIGVSANGTDAYFSTYETLVARDRNGNSLKFYDARTDGGFPEAAPASPCAAADECAGPGSSSAPAPQNGTGADLGTLGNVSPHSGVHRKGKKHHDHRHHKKRHRAGHRHVHRGGKK